MVDIFISYAKEDARHVKPLAEYLSSKGWSVFWDHNIPPGSTWVEYIGKNLDLARVVLVIWSEHSIESKWVRREASIALDKELLLPVRLHDVIPPNIFSSVQSASLIGWDGNSTTPELIQLVGVIVKRIGEPGASGAAASPGHVKRTEQPRSSAEKSTPSKKSAQQSKSSNRADNGAQIAAAAPAKAKKNRLGLIAPIVLLGFLAVGGWFVHGNLKDRDRDLALQEEKTFWVRRSDSTDPSVIREYIDKYGVFPGTFTEQARQRLKILEEQADDEALKQNEAQYWASIKDNKDVQALQDYLNQYGNNPGTFTKQAKAKLAELNAEADRETLLAEEKKRWSEVSASDDPKQVLAFLEQYGQSPGTYKDAAKRLYDKLVSDQRSADRLNAERAFWSRIKGSDDPKEFQAYLDRYGTDPGTYRAQAQAAYDKLVARQTAEEERRRLLQAERAMWDQIQASTNPNDFRSYLERYGTDPGTYRAQAQAAYDRLVAPPKPPTAPSATGRTVTRVVFGRANAKLGEFRKADGANWQEVPASPSGNSFNLVEIGRDDWSVYLHDGSRAVDIQIDLHTKKIYYSDPRTPRQQLYDVLTAASVTVQPVVTPQTTGRTVTRVAFGRANDKLGEFRKADGANWQEVPASPSGNSFNFVETGRDDWSVYLHDGSRAVDIQIDLHTKKIYYSDPRTSRQELYDVLTAASE